MSISYSFGDCISMQLKVIANLSTLVCVPRSNSRKCAALLVALVSPAVTAYFMKKLRVRYCVFQHNAIHHTLIDALYNSY